MNQQIQKPVYDDDGDLIVFRKEHEYTPVISFKGYLFTETANKENAARIATGYIRLKNPDTLVIAYHDSVAFATKRPYSIWLPISQTEPQVGLQHRIEEGTDLNGVERKLTDLFKQQADPRIVIIVKSDNAFDMYLKNSQNPNFLSK